MSPGPRSKSQAANGSGGFTSSVLRADRICSRAGASIAATRAVSEASLRLDAVESGSIADRSRSPLRMPARSEASR